MHLASNIDIPNGLVGGLILGLSSTAFLVLTGKITGLSGIAEGLVKVGGDDWNWTYIAGLTASGVVLSKLKPDSFGDSTIAPAVCIAAGILTGFGTRLAAGCTSGHGLCGLSRRSPRSLAAVLSFMFSGAATAYLIRSKNINLDFLPNISIPTASPLLYWGPTAAVLALSAIASKPAPAKKVGSNVAMHFASFASALAFGLGLGVSGMCSPDRVLGFLDFSNPTTGWDLTLMSVLGAGVTVTFITFHYFKSAKTPVVLSSTQNLGDILKMGLVKENLVVDWKLVLGSLIFGVGWGIAGMCPGPAVVSMGASVSSAGLFMPSMLLGMKIKEWLV